MDKENGMCARDSLDELVQETNCEENACVGDVSDEQGTPFLFNLL